MQCADAQSLLKQGIFPGAADHVRTVLGFHLAQCSACRTFRITVEEQRLLHSLLSRPALAPIGPTLALRPTPAPRPAARAQRGVGAALLVAGALAVVPIANGTTAQATVLPAPAPASVGASLPVVVQQHAPPAVAAIAPAVAAIHRATQQPNVSAPRKPFSLPIDSRSDPDLVSAKRTAYKRTPSTAIREARDPSTEWATFAASNAGDAARSQLVAFEQAGPQQLPVQLLQSDADEVFAGVQLEAGQVLFLPEEPFVPPEPPSAVFVPAESLPALPATPAAPRPRPASQPATKPTTTVHQSSRTYTVKAGDTLNVIAQRLYGNAASWRAIYEANRNVIGSNPNLIRPSQKLVVPALQTQSGSKTPTPSTQRIYTVRSGDTLSAIALEFYGNGNLWPVLYAANRATIGGDPDLIFPQQRLAVPTRTHTGSTSTTKPVAKPAVKATGKLSYVVAKGDSLRGLALRVYGNESRWQEIYRANRSLIPNPDRLQIGITLTIP